MNDRSMTADGYLPRHIDGPLRDACDTFPIVVLDGARGVGKTTTAKRVAGSMVSLPDDLDRLEANAVGYLESLPKPVLIDEWQLAGTDLLWTLKRLADADPTPGQFLLTGSVEPASYGPTYPLTGRAVTLVVRPMTAAELDGRGDRPSWIESIVGGRPPKPSAGRSSSFDIGWLARPGLPAARQLVDPALFLESYAALVSQRAGDEGRDASRLLTTMRVLATLEGQTIPDQRIWESADINKATWKAYEDLLARTHLAVPSPAFQSNRLKRLTTYPKRFLADVALALALGGLDADDLRHSPSIAGAYLESFVAQQLRPQVDLVGGTFGHLRTGSNQREIDVVIEIGLDVVAVEVKNSTRPGAGDAGHLAWMRNELGERFVAGFVVHTGGDTYPLDDAVWAIPVDVVSGVA